MFAHEFAEGAALFARQPRRLREVAVRLDQQAPQITDLETCDGRGALGLERTSARERVGLRIGSLRRLAEPKKTIIGQQERPMHGILELTHVAGPPMFAQMHERLAIKAHLML